MVEELGFVRLEDFKIVIRIVIWGSLLRCVFDQSQLSKFEFESQRVSVKISFFEVAIS